MVRLLTKRILAKLRNGKWSGPLAREGGRDERCPPRYIQRNLGTYREKAKRLSVEGGMQSENARSKIGEIKNRRGSH